MPSPLLSPLRVCQPLLSRSWGIHQLSFACQLSHQQTIAFELVLFPGATPQQAALTLVRAQGKGWEDAAGREGWREKRHQQDRMK